MMHHPEPALNAGQTPLLEEIQLLISGKVKSKLELVVRRNWHKWRNGRRISSKTSI